MFPGHLQLPTSCVSVRPRIQSASQRGTVGPSDGMLAWQIGRLRNSTGEARWLDDQPLDGTKRLSRRFFANLGVQPVSQ